MLLPAIAQIDCGAGSLVFLRWPSVVLFAVAIGFIIMVPYPSPLAIALVSALLALNDPGTGLEVLAAASCLIR